MWAMERGQGSAPNESANPQATPPGHVQVHAPAQPSRQLAFGKHLDLDLAQRVLGLHGVVGLKLRDHSDGRQFCIDVHSVPLIAVQ